MANQSPQAPDLTIQSNASLPEWGATTNCTATGGLWFQAEKALHQYSGADGSKGICQVERRPLHLSHDGQHISSGYVNHLGGTQSTRLAQQEKQLWLWCLDRRITLSAEYLPGKSNVSADLQSRSLTSTAERKLDLVIFQQLVQQLGPCNVDPFAMCLNAQLEQYITWKPKPSAMATNTLQVPADLQSRSLTSTAERKLDPVIFQQLVQQ